MIGAKGITGVAAVMVKRGWGQIFSKSMNMLMLTICTFIQISVTWTTWITMMDSRS